MMPMITMPMLLCAAAMVGMVWPASRTAQAREAGPAPSVVVLVRHAEKACAPPDDPPLSDAGERRARALVDALRDAGVGAVITTEFRRTRDTAGPIATRLHVDPVIVRAGGNPAHIDQVVEAIAASGEDTVLVVGHSNTLPDIVRRLGGPTLEAIADTSYSHLFIVERGGTTRLIRARYGDADRADGRDCG